MARNIPLFFLLLITLISLPAWSRQAPEVPNADALRNMEGPARFGPRKKPKLSKEAKAFLSPPEDLKQYYKVFLKGKNTGLVKLLPPREKIDTMMVSADTPIAFIPFRDGGSSYSFSKREYGDQDIVPEIRLINVFDYFPPEKAFSVRVVAGPISAS
jgi:hypothetical protein